MAEMESELPGFTAQAAADLTNTRYHILRWAAAGTTNIASHAAATAVLGAIGVQQNVGTSGQAVKVSYTGQSKVVAGGAVTANVLITNNGSGRAAAATSGDIVVGRALEAATQDGDVIRCLLQQPVPLLRT